MNIDEFSEYVEPNNYSDLSGFFCDCGKELTVGEYECFGCCYGCYTDSQNGYVE